MRQKSLKALALIVGLCAMAVMPAQAQYRYADSDPVYIQGKPPTAYPIHGIDVSRYQGPINWNAVKQSGIRFAYLKATEGKDYVDPMYRAHLHGAYAARVRVGAYHFYHFCSSPEAQAALFSRVVERSDGWLPPVVDLEWHHQSSCRRRPSHREIYNEISRFNAAMMQRYGQRPIIYTNPSFYVEEGLWQFRNSNEFWLRSTTANPSIRYRGQNWAFWQYTGTGRIPGVRGNVDINVFAGSEEDWGKWLRSRGVRRIEGVW